MDELSPLISLEEDPEAFAAALCFVDECMEGSAPHERMQAGPASSFSPSDASSALLHVRGMADKDAHVAKSANKRPRVKKTRGGDTLTPARPAKEPKKPKPLGSVQKNRVRDLERKELLYLREKVVDMEQKLEALEKTRGPGVSIESGAKTEVNATPSSLVDCEVPGVWKDMATHQLEQRLKAERENRRLKLVLEGQIKVAKSLEKLLQARSTTHPMESCMYGTQRLRRIYPTEPERSGSDVFEELLAGVGKAYDELDSVFHASGLDKRESSFNDAQMREDGDGIYMKIFASKILPFDVASTGTAAWKYFARSLEHRPFRYLYQKKDPQKVESTDDTIVESFILELHANGTKADYRVKQVLRRYVEADRVVIVWRSFIDPVEFAGAPIRGAEFHEKGYLVVRRPSAMSPQYSLLQTCYLITPAVPMRWLSGEGAVAGALTDFVLSGTEANVAACHQMIENILFNEAMKSHGRARATGPDTSAVQT